MFTHKTQIFLVLFILSACGKNNSQLAQVRGEAVIIGEVDWQDVTDLDDSAPERVNSHFVADLRIPAASSRCTGFMISEDYLVTNEHCIESSSDARGVLAIFNHEKGVSSSQWHRYLCDEFVTNSRILDYAILKCKGSPGLHHGYVKFELEKSVKKSDSLYVIQQNCDWRNDDYCDYSKKIAFGNVVEINSDIVHNADTLGGSSGSPVFNSSHKLIGLHHAGRTNVQTGEGIENYAVPASEIYADISTYFSYTLPVTQEGEWADFENNNLKKRAVWINYGGEVVFSGKISKGSDRDYYQIKVEKTQNIRFHLKFLHTVGNLDLKIFNSKKRKIAKSKSRSNDEVIELNLDPGFYYVKVYGRGNATAPYSMSIQDI